MTYVIHSNYPNGDSYWVRETLAEAKQLVGELLLEESVYDEKVGDEIIKLVKLGQVCEAHSLWTEWQFENEDFVDSIIIIEVTDHDGGGARVQEY